MEYFSGVVMGRKLVPVSRNSRPMKLALKTSHLLLFFLKHLSLEKASYCICVHSYPLPLTSPPHLPPSPHPLTSPPHLPRLPLRSCGASRALLHTLREARRPPLPGWVRGPGDQTLCGSIHPLLISIRSGRLIISPAIRKKYAFGFNGSQINLIK